MQFEVKDLRIIYPFFLSRVCISSYFVSCDSAQSHKSFLLFSFGLNPSDRRFFKAGKKISRVMNQFFVSGLPKEKKPLEGALKSRAKKYRSTLLFRFQLGWPDLAAFGGAALYSCKRQYCFPCRQPRR